MLSKKHYKAIAKIINDLTPNDGFIGVSELIYELAKHFKDDNSQFDSIKFYDACGYDYFRDEDECFKCMWSS